MKIKDIAPLGLLILVAVLIVVVIWSRGKVSSQEGFQTGQLQIGFCPLGSKQFQTIKGHTDCCDGDILNKKCRKKAICTLSAPHDGIPSCTTYVANYLRGKARAICPAKMPNYFEDVRNPRAARGCTASPLNATGSGPLVATSARCTSYQNAAEERRRPDSCANQKKLETITCPNYPAKRSTAQILSLEGAPDAVFQCNIVTPIGLIDTCYDDASIRTYLDKMVPRWQNSPTDYTRYFCSAYKAKNIDKTS